MYAPQDATVLSGELRSKADVRRYKKASDLSATCSRIGLLFPYYSFTLPLRLGGYIPCRHGE